MVRPRLATRILAHRPPRHQPPLQPLSRPPPREAHMNLGPPTSSRVPRLRFSLRTLLLGISGNIGEYRGQKDPGNFSFRRGFSTCSLSKCSVAPCECHTIIPSKRDHATWRATFLPSFERLERTNWRLQSRARKRL